MPTQLNVKLYLLLVENINKIIDTNILREGFVSLWNRSLRYLKRIHVKYVEVKSPLSLTTTIKNILCVEDYVRGVIRQLGFLTMTQKKCSKHLVIYKTGFIRKTQRHFLDWWMEHRGLPSREGLEDALCALLFNVSGYLHETLKDKRVE